MTKLCPTCNGTISRRHADELGEDILFCRVCRRYSLEGLSQWVSIPDADYFRTLAKQRDDDKRRQHEMMTSDISDPRWTQIYI